ncbi:MAG: MerR family transcriptional regulator [Clostridia bacterium]|nr:MerR family transcriptional regulator [Clostridia bacterium]
MNISTVEKLTGLPATAIRYYESRGLITVKRKDNGYRSYDEESVQILLQIRRLRELDVPLSDIRLWRDGVVTHSELIIKRLRALDDDSQKSRECRTICEALLKGDDPVASFSTAPFAEEEGAELSPHGGPLLLGIDIGTTSISAQVVASDSGVCVQTYNFDHNTAITVDGYPDAFAADADLLIRRATALIASVTATYPTIASIGIAGQMHGVICVDESGEILSPLYTWQNGFGQRKPDGKRTICEEIAALSGEMIPTGYGITTYYALRRLGLLPARTAAIVTVMDLLVARLTGTKPLIHPTNAAAMGAYDLEAGQFQADVLEKLQIPRTVLPDIAGGYWIVGTYDTVDRQIPVAVSIGDNQAGLLGSLADDRRVLVNVGTSSQVSVITDDPTPLGGEVRPYFDGKYICSGAALCGGRAYTLLKNFIRSIASGLGMDLSDRAIYDYLNRAAKEGKGAPLAVSTQFDGTRENPDARGAITGIGLQNFTPEALSAGFLQGIVEELYQMYTQMGAHGNVTGIVASGNAMRKNPALREICAATFGKELLLPLHTEEAAFGAALFGGVAAGVILRGESYAKIHYQNVKEEIE